MATEAMGQTEGLGGAFQLEHLHSGVGCGHA